MNYPISLNADRGDIAIMRVENGWLIRTNYGMSSMGQETPLKVAETPAALVEIIRQWAEASVNQNPIDPDKKW